MSISCSSCSRKPRKTAGVTVQYVKVLPDGSPDIDDLERLLQNDNTKKLVSLIHVNNELGTIADLETIGNLCRKTMHFSILTQSNR
ncbi:MAG: hypothetical protein CM15mP83_9590 [Flavobacteriaceae bacterium]|nr:MAG: hypothetical protein CM15mP83_9590 [Flavobacteriaceae bacterium]